MEEDRIPLPTDLDQVTAEWLSQAIAVSHPEVEVRSLEIDDVIWGTATKITVSAGYNQAGEDAGLPERLLVKAGFGRHELSAAMLRFYEGEVGFYRHGAPLLEIGLPRCHFAGIDADAGSALVVLEHLSDRGASFPGPAATTSPEAAAEALDLLAALHATTWGHAVLDQFELYPGAMRPVLSQVLEGEYWLASAAKPRAAGLPDGLREPGAMLAAVEALWEFDAAGSGCLIHGDAHYGNSFLEADGTPGFVDWQMAGRGHWAHDVAYFVIGALTVEDRRGAERDLLAHYLESLASDGAPAPALDDAWEMYRRHALHGVFWVVNPDGMYPEEVNTAMVDRFGAAVDDHDTLALLAD